MSVSADTRDMRRLLVARGRLTAHIDRLARDLVHASESEYRDISYRIHVVSGRVDVLTTEINGLRDSSHEDLDSVIRSIAQAATTALELASTEGVVKWRAGLERVIWLAERKPR